jgi:NAD(P)-dependent dehydrogenase (short-subunit alcohol dehydrogenase family)
MKAEKLFDMTGKVAFVTGAGDGLGRAMAEVMAENGALTVMTDIDPAKLEAAAAPLKKAGCKIETAVVDVADFARLESAIDDVVKKHGRLDTVFANAGISAGRSYLWPEGRIDAVDMKRWDEVVHVNLTSVFMTMRRAAHHMRQQKSGRIIVTASIGGMQAEHMVGYAYAATKAAIINLVRQASRELAPHNVLVNAIAPGPFLTNIAGGRLHTEPDVRKAFEDIIPLKRLGTVEEIKGLALYLGSGASSFMTGTCIPIDGGATSGA